MSPHLVYASGPKTVLVKSTFLGVPCQTGFRSAGTGGVGWVGVGWGGVGRGGVGWGVITSCRLRSCSSATLQHVLDATLSFCL